MCRTEWFGGHADSGFSQKHGTVYIMAIHYCMLEFVFFKVLSHTDAVHVAEDASEPAFMRYPKALCENIIMLLFRALQKHYVKRSAQQNNKDNQGLFAATLSFMLSQSSGNKALIVLVVLLCITLCLCGVEHCQHSGYILRCKA